VAVVMAAAAMTAAPAAEFLAQARSIAPAAKRVLVVPRGGPAAPSLRVPVPLVADRRAATPGGRHVQVILHRAAARRNLESLSGNWVTRWPLVVADRPVPGRRSMLVRAAAPCLIW
jgi:hypothetical protein